MSRPSPRAARVAVALVVLGVLSGVAFAARGGPPGLLAELTRETRNQGVAGMRLSIASQFRACGDEPGDAPCEVEKRVPSPRELAVIRRATEAARSGVDPEAMHVAALAMMLYPTSGGNHLDPSISYLQSASRLSERPARILADLAAAHLMRARETGSARSLYEALEAAERALELEPTLAPALFNAAAALDGMGAAEQARAAWTRYLAVDSTSGWASEARKRRARTTIPRPRPVPARTADREELQAYAAATPSGAREFGWDDLLREWGTSILDGDTATARARLEKAEVLGAALENRGGDRSLADATAAIRARAGNGAVLRRLARGHVELGEGRKALAHGHDKACPRFRQAMEAGLTRPAREWAESSLGFCPLYERAGLRLNLQRLAEEADSVRYPALAGRKWLALASAHYRDGGYVEALAAYTRASELFSRAGEGDYASTARMHTGDVWSLLGEADTSYAILHEELRVLREFPGSLGLWNGLYALRNALDADGLQHAAMHVQDEAVAVTRWMRPELQAETRLARARLHLAAGRRNIDQDTIVAANVVNGGIAAEYLREYVRADQRQTRAEAWLQATPGRAAAELDSVVRFFDANVPRLLPALFSRARARLAQGMQDSAGVDLLRAMTILDGQRVRVSSAALRASLLEQSRRVFDQAVMLSVRAGRNGEALDYVERSRSSFSPVGRSAQWASRPLRAPRGQVAVEFAMVGDTLLAWTLWDGGMHFSRRTVNRADLVRNVERVRSALELRAAGPAVLTALDALYDELIRPLRPRLGPSGTPLVIVADGELAALPFAALRDRERRRYLVEDHAVRFASSLRDPTEGVRSGHGLPVTLVADPAFDGRGFPELQRLAGAAAEVTAIGGLYANARIVDGVDADAKAIGRAFRRGGIAHFAGHAIFDDARPERSFLVAAPGSEAASARITAAEIEQMDLDGLRLVVLSACQTARAQAGRSGGFAGLAGAFLAAGAGGVVGSLWRVDDTSTRTLMKGFHAAYRESGDAAGALRQAQLQMLRSPDPALHSPAAWAGFRYAGS